MRTIVLISFIFSICGCFSQSIENVDFRAEGKTIVVGYDLFHINSDTTINIKLEFKNPEGVVVSPKTISGDIKGVSPGTGKRIVWDVLSDGVSLSGRYMALVTADKDNKLSTTKIGTQEWTTENLNVSTFRNGDPIPYAKTDEEWSKAGKNMQPAWCYYGNDPANGNEYGKLYNWYAVNDARGLAPKGYHIPSDAEWSVLTDYLGGEYIAGGKMKSAGTQYWRSPNEGATNKSGFSGLPGGYRDGNGAFDYVGEDGGWWSSSEDGTDDAGPRYRLYDDGDVYRNDDDKGKGVSVRCLRDYVEEEIIEFLDIEAEFVGGAQALMKFIADNVQYPPTSIEMNEQGKVYLSFVVESDGSISNVAIERGVSKDIDAEAKRLVRSMPKWTPGEAKGKKCRTRCRMPINFQLG